MIYFGCYCLYSIFCISLIKIKDLILLKRMRTHSTLFFFSHRYTYVVET